MQRILHGRWKVVPSDRRERITCETFDDARRVAYLAVAHTRPCELIVRDAYHRVIHRELIDGAQAAQTGWPLPDELQPERIAPAGGQPPRSRQDGIELVATGRRRGGLGRRRSACAKTKQTIQKGGH